MVTWRWVHDQNTVIGRWKVIGPRISVHTVGFLAFTIDSLSCLVLRWPSVSKILAPDQSMTWFSFATWSVMADLLVSVAKSFRSARVNVLLLMDSTSFLCFSQFLQCTYCCSYGTESCRHTHLSGQLYVYPWDGLERPTTYDRILVMHQGRSQDFISTEAEGWTGGVQ